MLPPQALGEIINRQSIAHDVRPDIVACIIAQESGKTINGAFVCDTFAWRWEEKFYADKLVGKKSNELAGWVPVSGTLPSLTDEKLQRSCSYGLMQVLGDTARWCGKVTAPFLTVLCDPDRGIDVGCRVLSFYLGRAKGDYRAALKGYNGAWTYADEVLGRVARGEHLKFFKGS